MSQPVVGIIAEYNPFHNGHARQIEMIREKYKGAPVVAVMSGSFVQRGLPALFDKWTRSRLALAGGADLVLELPAACALQSAEGFARGGLQLLAAAGIVTHISFGCETENFPLLRRLAEEKISSKERQQALARGNSYAKALEALYAARNPAYRTLLQGSNNLLALEYLKALRAYPQMQALPVKRAGEDYGTLRMGSPLASASAIRLELRTRGLTPSVKKSLPKDVCTFLQETALPDWDKAAAAADLLLAFALEKTSPAEIRRTVQVSEGLENLLYKHRRGGFAAILKACSTRRYSPSRIRRSLWQLLLSDRSIPFKDLASAAPGFLRILGFNRTGQELLHWMKKEARLPLLTTVEKNTLQKLPEPSRSLLALDLRSTNLHELLFQGKISDLDYKVKPAVLL